MLRHAQIATNRPASQGAGKVMPGARNQTAFVAKPDEWTCTNRKTLVRTQSARNIQKNIPFGGAGTLGLLARPQEPKAGTPCPGQFGSAIQSDMPRTQTWGAAELHSAQIVPVCEWADRDSGF